MPSAQDDLAYSDWAKLVSGLMNDTPLGKIIEIRSETESDIIKNMTREQLVIRSEWENFRNSNIYYDDGDLEKQAEHLENMMKSLFG